ncbi:MAG: 3-isopropylmalate dehydrogenase, partial [Spirochaetia bacterium]|nr:3-isopropylmalate dehydrogenase [Spirochaetia bacterium]
GLAEADVGGIAIDRHGEALPKSTLDLCDHSEAILFGSIGGPKWETLPADKQPERAALLPIRKHYGLYANLRPAIIYPALIAASPLRPDLLEGGLDILVIRELTGGLYFGQPKLREKDRALDTMVYTREEIVRIGHVAFKAARKRGKKVCSIDKANVLTTMVFWRELITELGKQYPDVALSHMYVDNAAMQLVRNPKQFDVLLCENMFGDILSDEASMITGSIGMLPSASLANGKFGLYEPSGGSAPDIAGQGIANPIAQILSVALMLEYSFDQTDAPLAIREAVKKVLGEGYRTKDIHSAGTKLVGTKEMGDLIAARL